MIDWAAINRIDRRFFEKYQCHLLRFANSSIGRWYFRVREHPKSRQFARIDPNALFWLDGENLVVEFRTANRYANRLKCSFRFLKSVIKILSVFGVRSLAQETAFLLAPIFMMGGTYTFYPDANTETTSVDGKVTRTAGGLGSGESWSNLRSGAGTSFDDSTADELAARWVADNVLNQWRIQDRSLYLFDTSALTSGATVGSATFSLYISILTAPLDATASKRELRVVSSNPASNTGLANGDYGNLGATEFGHFTYGSVTTGQYNDVSLNASGLSNISLTGISKFGCLSGADMDNSAPTWVSFDTFAYQVRFAETSGTTSDPKLTVVVTAFSKTLSETLVLTDAIQKRDGRTLTETMTFTDSVVGLLVKVGTFIDTLNLSDSTRRTVSRIFNETITHTEVFTRTIFRRFSETLTLMDTVSRTFVKIISEVISFVESFSISRLWTRRTKPTSIWTNRNKPPTTWSS